MLESNFYLAQFALSKKIILFSRPMKKCKAVSNIRNHYIYVLLKT